MHVNNQAETIELKADLLGDLLLDGDTEHEAVIKIDVKKDALNRQLQAALDLSSIQAAMAQVESHFGGASADAANVLIKNVALSASATMTLPAKPSTFMRR